MPPSPEPHWFTVLTYLVLATVVMLVLVAGAIRVERAATLPMPGAEPGQPLILQGMS